MKAPEQKRRQGCFKKVKLRQLVRINTCKLQLPLQSQVAKSRKKINKSIRFRPVSDLEHEKFKKKNIWWQNGLLNQRCLSFTQSQWKVKLLTLCKKIKLKLLNLRRRIRVNLLNLRRKRRVHLLNPSREKPSLLENLKLMNLCRKRKASLLSEYYKINLNLSTQYRTIKANLFPLCRGISHNLWSHREILTMSLNLRLKSLQLPHR